MTNKVVTGTVRLNHVHLFEQFTTDNGTAFSVMIMIPKSDKKTMKAIRAAEAFAAEQAKDTKFNGKIPKRLRSIIKDADVEDDDGEIPAEQYPEQENHYFAWVRKSGSGKDKAPSVIDVDGTEMMDPDDIKSGDYARVSMEAYAYNVSGNQGVTFSLRGVKKVSDGEALGPVDDVASDFEDELL